MLKKLRSFENPCDKTFETDLETKWYLFVYQITLKSYRMPQSFHLLKSKNILKIFFFDFF